MATRKAKKEEAPKAEKKADKTPYFYGVGRRKASIAQVRIYEDEKAAEGDSVINGKDLKKYFPMPTMQNNVLAPLRNAGTAKFRMTVLVSGGGLKGQSEAIRLGVARALVNFNAELKKSLKDAGFLTRDARVVERKKPGLKKARRAPQWAKR